ncbi:44276_t:CDS:1, partial [Gigaspora margarita]
ACEKFYLQLTRNSQEIQGGNWFLKAGLGRHTLANMMNDIAQASKINVTDQRITNHSGRRTAIQLLSDLNINEHEMMQFSGHRSTNGLRSYKVPNREQKLKNTALLINAIQELQIPTQESQALTNDESQALIDKEPQALTNEESQTSTHKEPQISTQKNIRIKKRTSKLTEEEIQLKLVRPFRSPLQTLQNKTQNVVTTKDGTTNIFEFHNS